MTFIRISTLVSRRSAVAIPLHNHSGLQRDFWNIQKLEILTTLHYAIPYGHKGVLTDKVTESGLNSAKNSLVWIPALNAAPLDTREVVVIYRNSS